MPIAFNLPIFENQIDLKDGNKLFYDPHLVELHQLNESNLVLIWGAVWNCSPQELKSHFENNRRDLISGDFLALLIDLKNYSFCVFNDLLGTRSLFYHQGKNQFSSHLFALGGTLNSAWWVNYFRGKDSIEGEGPIHNVVRLKSDELLKFQNSQLTKCSSSFSLIDEIEKSLAQAGTSTFDQCRDYCREMVKQNLGTTLKIGRQPLLLGSLGVDSNSLLALADEESLSSAMKITMNHDYQVKKDLYSDNMKHLKAKDFKVLNFSESQFSTCFEHYLTKMTKPMSNYWTFAIVEGYLLSRERPFDFFVTGLGGDELFFHRLHYFESFAQYFSLSATMEEGDYINLPSDKRFAWNGETSFATWIDHSLKWNRGIYEHCELEFMTGRKVFSPLYDRRLMFKMLSLDPEQFLSSMRDARIQKSWISDKSPKAKILAKNSNHFSPTRSFALSQNYAEHINLALEFIKRHAPDISPHYQQVAKRSLDKGELDLESARLVVFGHVALCRF